MKELSHSRLELHCHRRARIGTLCIALIGFFAAALLSQAQADDVAAAKLGRSNVIDSQEVVLGSRSIIYNRIVPPVLKPSAPPQAASGGLQKPLPTAEDLTGQRAWEAKKPVLMFLTCTVYDRSVSEVRWWHEGGEYVVWSSIDFNHLPDVLDFETASARLSVMAAVGNESRHEAVTWNTVAASDPEMLAYARDHGVDFRVSIPPQRIPGASESVSAYQLVSTPPGGASPLAIAALNALHRYYDANRQRLVRAFEQSEAARLAREASFDAHQPQPQDTTVTYFPIRSAYSNEQPEGEQ